MNEPIEAELTGEELAVATKPEQLPATIAEPTKPQLTAAQAKVEAVAALTMKAYERASLLTLTPEESQALQADFPDEAFQPGAAGKENLIYIEHAHLRDRLNKVFGLGQWAIVPRSRWAEDFSFVNKYNVRIQGSRVYVEAMLLVRGCFVAEAVGDMVYYKNNDSQNYGDAVEGAKTAALRRCAKELGIGLQAWKKDWCAGWWERKRGHKSTKTVPESPKAHFQGQGGQNTAPAPAQPQEQPDDIRTECLLVGFKEASSAANAPKKWHAWFAQFKDDAGNDFEAGTFDTKLGEKLEVLTNTTVEIVYRPSKSKPGKFELVSIEPSEVVP